MIAMASITECQKQGHVSPTHSEKIHSRNYCNYEKEKEKNQVSKNIQQLGFAGGHPPNY
jgi:hypothetical protein